MPWTKAHTIINKLSQSDKNHVLWQVDLAESLFRYALINTMRNAAKQERALSLYRDYLAIYVMNNPDSLSARVDLISRLFSNTVMSDEDRTQLETALEILTHLQKQDKLDLEETGRIEIIKAALTAKKPTLLSRLFGGKAKTE